MSNPFVEVDFFKNRDVFTFACKSFHVSYGSDFYQRKDMIHVQVQNILNIVIRCVENILEWSEKQFHLQKTLFPEILSMS